MSRYQIIYQKPFHCAIACLAMIIYRHSGILIDQEEVGQRLGVCVPVKHREMFAYDLGSVGILSGNNEGIPTLEKIEDIQRELTLLIGPVNIERVDGDRRDFLEMIDHRYQVGDDVWLERVLHTPNVKIAYVHDQLYDGQTQEGIALIDPEPEARNRTSVSPEELRASVDGSYIRTTWALIITRLSNK